MAVEIIKATIGDEFDRCTARIMNPEIAQGVVDTSIVQRPAYLALSQLDKTLPSSIRLAEEVAEFIERACSVITRSGQLLELLQVFWLNLVKN